MSSEGDDIPEELLWRGDVDDGSADLFFLGDDDLDDDLGGGSNLVMRKGTDYSIGVDNDDDPLGGLKILGSIHDSLEEAVTMAFAIAEFEDNIVFSPGFASFDMFENYVQRGEAFRKAIDCL